MVAKIIISKSITKALNYNEQKVSRGQAECIYAGNFIKEKEDMNFHEQRERFTNLIGRNASKTNTLHISLNFDPSEKLSNEKMADIAAAYMEKIGFSEQPFLVYRHHDAGHPHVHIVTTNICTDGTRIKTHNIGKDVSEPARKEIEKEFQLVEANARKVYQLIRVPAIDSQKVVYGKSEIKRSITNALDYVLRQYQFTSLPELNAILKSYNVYADRCRENSRTYKNGGLVYRVLDRDGKKIGVPIKASSIYSKPTLTNLQTHFTKNEEKRKPHRQAVKEKIDQSFEKAPSIRQFLVSLRKKGIEMIPRVNEQDLLYGITFVDHKLRCVFNGSDLGKEYSAAAFREKLVELRIRELLAQSSGDKTSQFAGPEIESKLVKEVSSPVQELFKLLLKTESGYSFVPTEPAPNKRRKRKKNLGL